MTPDGSIVAGKLRDVASDRLMGWTARGSSGTHRRIERIGHRRIDCRAHAAEAGIVALHARPDAPVPTHVDCCRPYVERGPLLDAIRDRLRQRSVRVSTTARSRRSLAG